MKKQIVRFLYLPLFGFVLALAGLSSAEEQAAPPAPKAAGNPVVIIQTSAGTIEAELFAKKAPKSVANFLAYAKSGFYDGTIFHRVIPSFMIQGGGFDTNFNKKPTRAPIVNEAGNGLRNEKGTLAMARTGEVDSATAQFFINAKNNAFLDQKDTTQRGFGYAVFGKVIKGMDVVRKIEDSKTSNFGGAFANRPVETIEIESIRLKPAA